MKWLKPKSYSICQIDSSDPVYSSMKRWSPIPTTLGPVPLITVLPPDPEYGPKYEFPKSSGGFT
ncbi:MAG: hypothetical protein ACRELY_25985 [Polyangiaceae bacterium]